MNKLEQRCKGVKRVLDDYKIEYIKEFDSDKHLKIKNTPFHLEITNRYISISYKSKHYFNFLPSFEGINEFRKFIKNNGTNFMILKEHNND